jgi:Uma2 family endonuclease
MRQQAAERITRMWTPSQANAVFELENGSRMDQKTFHALYLKTPEGFKAELIGGTVYVTSSPVSSRHGRPHARVVHWLGLYSDDTPGTEVMDNTTNILGDESEPQPDAFLYVTAGYGGRSTIDDMGYINGPVELVVEVANTTRAIDLGSKMRDYELAGVREYIVVLAQDERIAWFARGDEGLMAHPAGGDGVFRSAAFPGLWLDPRGLFAESTRPLTAAVKKGLASPEHTAFVAELQARRKKVKPAAKKSKKK